MAGCGDLQRGSHRVRGAASEHGEAGRTGAAECADRFTVNTRTETWGRPVSYLRNMLDKWKRKRRAKSGTGIGRLVPGQWGGDEPPVIQTTWGPVSEGARLRAALNLREDLGKRRQVEKLLANQLFGGDLVRGREEAMRRYPEAYVLGL